MTEAETEELAVRRRKFSNAVSNLETEFNFPIEEYFGAPITHPCILFEYLPCFAL